MPQDEQPFSKIKNKNNNDKVSIIAMISNGFFALSIFFKFIGTLPLMRIVTISCEQACSFIGYVSWLIAIKLGNKSKLNKDNDIKIKNLNIAAAALGMISATLAITSFILFPPAAILLVAPLIVGSDTFWTIACWKEYYNELKQKQGFSNDNNSNINNFERQKLLSSKKNYAIYATALSSSAGLSVFTLAANILFPPLLIPLGIATTICIGIGVVSWTMSLNINIFNKYQKQGKLLDNNQQKSNNIFRKDIKKVIKKAIKKKSDSLKKNLLYKFPSNFKERIINSSDNKVKKKYNNVHNDGDDNGYNKP